MTHYRLGKNDGAVVPELPTAMAEEPDIML
jgi:hypothetical protein